MRGAALWIIGLAGSVLAHVVVFILLEMSVTPDPLPSQPNPQSRVTLDGYQVDQHFADAEPAQGDLARQQQASGTALATAAIPRSRAKAQPANAEIAVAVEDAETPSLQASKPEARPVTIVSPPQAVAAVQTGNSSSAQLVEAIPDKTSPLPLPKTSTRAAPNADNSEKAKAVALPSEHAKAALAWNFGDRNVTDPLSLAVIQAFMAPSDLSDAKNDADAVRDSIAATLAGVDCARLTATFIPETGALELQGHIPDNGQRSPILTLLNAQVGNGITITDRLLHLPRPQCGALSGIASAGLPQSTDQFTNDLLIGENAHAKEYVFTEGQRLRFDLSAPDYDAYVYVDYFDADGQVIHLEPNDQVPLRLHPAKSTFGVGVETSDTPGLFITIGPPFGQEIVVAFASTAPLFDELRPLMEPADHYLEVLKSRITAARYADPAFKGEWVYFFVTTSPSAL